MESRATRLLIGVGSAATLVFLYVPLVIVVIYDNVGVAGNIPLAAAFALVPVAIMAVYLLLAKRAGAFEAL